MSIPKEIVDAAWKRYMSCAPRGETTGEAFGAALGVAVGLVTEALDMAARELVQAQAAARTAQESARKWEECANEAEDKARAGLTAAHNSERELARELERLRQAVYLLDAGQPNPFVTLENAREALYCAIHTPELLAQALEPFGVTEEDKQHEARIRGLCPAGEDEDEADLRARVAHARALIAEARELPSETTERGKTCTWLLDRAIIALDDSL